MNRIRLFAFALLAGSLPLFLQACAALNLPAAGEGGPTLADNALTYTRAVCELPEESRAEVLDALNAAAAPAVVSIRCP